MERPYLIVAGPPGVGKSTLTQALAKELDMDCFLESDTSNNNFLARFYSDMGRWAFHSQSFFLAEALRQQQLIASSTRGAVQDRSVWEHIGIFATNLCVSGHLSADEFKLLHSLADSVGAYLPRPTLLLYACAPRDVLLERIASRGRKYEQGMDPEYLLNLCRNYQRWSSEWELSPILELNAADIDFRQADDLAAVIDAVRGRLTMISTSAPVRQDRGRT
jgi:deoxyadenosine/deoxycytidine kinase